MEDEVARRGVEYPTLKASRTPYDLPKIRHVYPKPWLGDFGAILVVCDDVLSQVSRRSPAMSVEQTR
jgi:hypothetical protein